MEESDVSFIDELVELYKNRNRKTMNPSPYALYFLKNGKDLVLDESKLTDNKKPNAKNVMMRLVKEWARLSSDKKKPYFDAASKLGYIENQSFVSTNDLRNKIKEKTDKVKSRIPQFML